MRETCKLPTASLHAANRHPSFHAQSQRPPRDGAKLALSRIRQNLAQCNTVRQHTTKIRARACARGNGIPFLFSRHELRPARRGFLELPSPNRYANKSNRTPRSVDTQSSLAYTSSCM